MAEIGALRITIGLDSVDFTRGMQDINNRLRAVNSEFRATQAGAGRFDNSLDALRGRADVLNRTMELHRAKVQELRRRYEESARATGENSDETIRLATEYNNAVAAMRRTEDQLNLVNRRIEEQTDSWRQMQQRLQETGERLQNIGGKMTAIGKDLSMKVTAPLLAMGTAAFKAAVDFESAFAGVRKTVDGTEEEFAALEKGIRDMAKEIPAAATEIAGVAEAAGQLGIKKEAILGFTRTMIDLGEATNMTSDQAATDLARLANITQMNQKDFDRLGSSVVALGNTMATTESEIVSMSLRLAAQGAQVGMSEAQINALAATMSSLGIEAEAGGTAMTTVLKKLQTAVGSGGKDLAAFAKAAGVSSKEFKLAWEKDAVTALDMFIKGLSNSSKEGKNLTTILSDLGIKGIRESDTLLRMAGASDLLSSAVATSTKAWDENVALTNEAEQRYKTTASQMKILWNHVKELGITIGGILIPIAQDLMNKLKPIIQGFADMDTGTQKTVLAVGALVAAIGPLLVVGGTLVSGIGGLLIALGNTTGLAGVLTALTGPIGLTVAGITALAAAAAGVTLAVKSVNNDIKKAKEVNLEHAESMIEQQKELEELSKQYDVLRGKSQLSNDEILRFRDIQSELKWAKSAEEIKALTEEQAKLQEKSGLTNEEMSTMLQLNDDLIKLVPDVSKTLSEHGNVVISNSEAIGKANEKLKENIALELENQRIKADAKLDENIQKYIKALDDLNAKEKERNQIVKERDENEVRIGQLKVQAQNELNEGKDRQAQKTIKEIADAEILLSQQNDKIVKLADEVVEKQKSVTQTEKEIQKTQELYDKMINLHLEQVGINATGQEGIKQLDDAIKKTQTRISELNKVKNEQGSLNDAQAQELSNLQTSLGQYRSKKDEIKKIQGEQASVNQKIDEGTGKAKEMTKELSKDTTKNVTIDDKGKVKSLNDEISKSITKKVTLNATWTGISNALKKVLPFFAKGTTNAPGGLSVVGEAGRELLYANGSMYLAEGASLVNLPKGAKVIPNYDTEKILSKWNIPLGDTVNKFSSIINPNRMNNASGAANINERTITIQPAPIYLDGNLVGQVDFDLIEDGLNTRYTSKAIVNGVSL